MCVKWKCLVEYDGMVLNEYYLITIFDFWISKNIFRNNEFDKQWINDLKDEFINKNETLTAIFLIREITAIKATITVGCQMNAVARWTLPFTSITATLGMGCKKYIIYFFCIGSFSKNISMKMKNKNNLLWKHSCGDSSEPSLQSRLPSHFW